MRTLSEKSYRLRRKFRSSGEWKVRSSQWTAQIWPIVVYFLETDLDSDGRTARVVEFALVLSPLVLAHPFDLVFHFVSQPLRISNEIFKRLSLCRGFRLDRFRWF